MNDLIVFCSIVVAAFAIFSMLDAFRVSRPPALPQSESLDLLDAEPVPEWVGLLARAIPQLPIEKKRLQRDLLRIGDYQPHSLVRYLAIRNARLFAVLVVAAYFAVLLPEFRSLIIIVSVCAAIVLYAIPGLLLHRNGDMRVNGIMRALPDSLEVLSMCLSGGMQVDDSMRHLTRFANVNHPALALEFEILGRQAAATSSSEAMNRMGARLDVPEIRSLGLLLQQAERLGSSVSQGFDELAGSLRRAFRQKTEARANTLAMQLLFPVVFCMLPPIMIILLGPPLMDLKEHLSSNGTKSRIQMSSQASTSNSPNP